MSANPRVRAIQILQQIIGKQKKSLQEALTTGDSPFVYQLTYGTLRFYHGLSTMVNYALKQPLSIKEQDIHLLLIVGIYQIQHLDIPDYAIVKETVEAADILKKPWAKKLINAVLRRFLRERDIFEKQCLLSEEACYSHPQWFINKIKAAWPEQWKRILTANNEKAPMHLRVNRLKMSREAYQEALKQEDIESHPLCSSQEGLLLTQAMDVHKLPGFKEGWFSVQDAASQAVVDYLDLQPNLRVLDACAAPGGKTCHILEKESHLFELVALDVSPERLKRITDNIERLQLNNPTTVKLLCGDACVPESWWSNEKFDRILLDAPCSATGVIRRHPDIKLLRTPKEVEQAVQKQKQIIEALWPLLATNGRLVYTTCSVLPEENQQQIDTFIKNHANAKCISVKQILPGDNQDNTDGFFYAVLEKIL